MSVIAIGKQEPGASVKPAKAETPEKKSTKKKSEKKTGGE